MHSRSLKYLAQVFGKAEGFLMHAFKKGTGTHTPIIRTKTLGKLLRFALVAVLHGQLPHDKPA